MHPTLLRFLDAAAATQTLERAEREEPLADEERLYVQTALAHPARRRALVGAKGKAHPASDAQAALVFLAAHAALSSMGTDVELGPLLTKARSALLEEGATAAQADELLASILLEEGFGYDESPDEFDRAFMAQTLEEVPTLAALSADRLEQLAESFAETAEANARPFHRRAAAALFEEAFGEGPQPINSEHLEAALLRLEPDGEQGVQSLKELLAHLHRQGLLGKRRLSLLGQLVGEEPAED